MYNQGMRIFNKRARFEYELSGEGVEAGISLKGAEAKSLREGRGNLSQAYVKILGKEAFLVNANIPAQGLANYDSTRTRKLLLHHQEIVALATKMKARKLQIVPIRVYTKGRLIKLYCELGKPKRKFEKREALKRRDVKRELESQFKGSL